MSKYNQNIFMKRGLLLLMATLLIANSCIELEIVYSPGKDNRV
jgi:hypothetical protein